MNTILSRAIDDIFKIAKNKGIQAMHISESTGITNTQLSLIRHKKSSPRFDTIDKIACAVGTSLPLVLMKVLVPDDIPEAKRQQYLGIEPMLKALINSL